MSDIAIVTSRDCRHYNDDDRALAAALERRGLSAAPVAWTDPGIDWSTFRLAAIRSTWDYHENHDAFLAWVDRAAARTRVLNPPEVLWWNATKTYLGWLGERGVAVVPTVYVTRDDVPEKVQAPARAKERADAVARIVERIEWPRVIVKPTVSAIAMDTYLLSRDDRDGYVERIDALLARHDLMIQPYYDRVERDGEVSLNFIDMQYSHAVVKRPKPGDFRVQEEHGGSYEVVTASAADIDVATRAVEALGEPLLYSRADLIRDDDGGARLVELELIEPELHLRLVPAAAERLADAIARRVTP